MTGTSVSEADNKSFQEHLRTVHLALVATCFVLLVGASLIPKYSLENAYRQIQEIRRTAPALLESLYEASRAGELPNLSEQMRSLYQRTPFHIAIGNEVFAPWPSGTWWVRVEADSKRFLPDLDILMEHDPKFAPDTLTNFIRLWHALHRLNSLRVLAKLNISEAVIELDPADNARPTLLAGAAPDASAPRTVADLPRNVKVQPRSNAKGDELVWSVSGKQTRPSSPGQSTFKPWVIRVPVETVPFNVDLQRRVTATLGLSWPSGTFSESFGDLSDVAAEIESLRLAQLESYLKRLRSKEGSTIELFGAKLPADSIATWGLIALLSIQCYFFLQLRHYVESVPDTEQSWLFPWIGMYLDASSRLLSFITAVFFPIVTGVFLGVKSTSSAEGSLFAWLTWFLVALVVLIASFAMWPMTSIGTRKHRDRA